MKRRVVLYNPVVDYYTMPLALVAIASHLDRDRYDPVIVDGRLEADRVDAVLRAADGAACLGVTVLSGAPIRDAVRVSRAVKARYPALPVVWGGWHPSMFGAECLDEPSVDVTVQGQGEVTFVETVERLTRGEPLDGCLGSTYRAPDGTVRQNGARPLADVNTLSRHDYSLIDVERYYRLKGKPQLDYIASQGCRFRCAFCADPFVYQRRWVGLEPERIGHGIRAAQDERVMDLLRERGVVLEICPSSNLATGAVASLEELKGILQRFWSHGVRFTINTDGPYLLDTSMRREVDMLRGGLVLANEQIEQAFRWAREATFVPPPEPAPGGAAR
jgi:hypothetical protein